MEQKLVVVIMGPGKQHFAEMCLDSVKDADTILYYTSADRLPIWNMNVDTNPFIDIHYPGTEKEILIMKNEWDDGDKATNGKCRQKYLECLKETYPDDWCLVLDEDELVEDLSKIKTFIQTATPGIYNVKMRHFIGDIGHEDATRPVHVVPGRLFKISEAKGYPLHSHPVLEGELKGACLDTCIWHLGHLPIEYMDYILKRYKQHSEDSIIHTPEFLKQWKMAHLLGVYPKRDVNPVELPKQICDRYEIDKDEFYFANRQTIETKHFIMMYQWLEYFNPKSILDLGCGVGLYGYALKMLNNNILYKGVERSIYAVNLGKTLDLVMGDITKEITERGFDLVLCLDVLEHLKYEDLDNALNGIKLCGKQFLFSIPFLGDPNLEADSTHIIKETKEWWVEKLSQYFNIKDAPKEWLFANQLLIGERHA